MEKSKRAPAGTLLELGDDGGSASISLGREKGVVVMNSNSRLLKDEKEQRCNPCQSVFEK